MWKMAIAAHPGNLVNPGNLAENRNADRVVSGIEPNDPPGFGLEAEEAGELSRRSGRQAERRQHGLEIRLPIGVHFVVAVECEAAARAVGPPHSRERPARFAEPILRYFGGVTHIVDIA